MSAKIILPVGTKVQALDPDSGIWMLGKITGVSVERKEYKVKWSGYPNLDSYAVDFEKVRKPIVCAMSGGGKMRIVQQLRKLQEGSPVKKREDHQIAYVKYNDPFKCEVRLL